MRVTYQIPTLNSELHKHWSQKKNAAVAVVDEMYNKAGRFGCTISEPFAVLQAGAVSLDETRGPFER